MLALPQRPDALALTEDRAAAAASTLIQVLRTFHQPVLPLSCKERGTLVRKQYPLRVAQKSGRRLNRWA